VAVSDPSPDQAASIANTIGQVFIEQTRDQQAALTNSSREALQKNIDDVKKQIDDVTAQIAELEAVPAALSPTEQVRLTGLQTQLSRYQSTYSDLLESQQRMDLATAQLNNQVRIAEQAIPPTAFIKPRILLNTALAGVLGLVIALGLVALAGYLDDTVKTSDEVRRLTGKAALSLIPALESPGEVESLHAPRSAAAEGFRGLRTTLQFAALGQQIRSLVITSSRPGDGKTTLIANLGAVLAQGGQRVVLLDADLRKPRLHTYFDGVSNRTGLTSLLLAEPGAEIESLLQPTEIPGLRVLATGPLPPNPADVLNSPRMQEIVTQLEQTGDILLIDSPPMAVSDALVISGLVDGVVVVTTGNRTRSAELTRMVQEFTRTSTPLVGVVINRADTKGEEYYSYYRSYYDADVKRPAPQTNGAAPEPDDQRAASEHPVRRLGDSGN